MKQHIEFIDAKIYLAETFISKHTTDHKTPIAA